MSVGMRTMLLIPLALVAVPAMARPQPSIRALEARSDYANDRCRDQAYLDPDTNPNCIARTRLDRELRRRGICWAYSDMRGLSEADFDWHPCSQPRPLKHR